MIEVDLIKEVLLYSVLLGFITAALVEVIKRTLDKKLKPNYLPLIAIVVGLILGVITPFIVPDMTIVERALAGVISGLTASGIFQLPKQLKSQVVDSVMNSNGKPKK